MTGIRWVYNDGGRAQAGYKGDTGDCAVRALAIVTGMDYQVVYDTINDLAKLERPRRGKRRAPPKRSNARTGVHPQTVERFLVGRLGWRWVSTMGIGTGCQVHLSADELPTTGPLVARLSKHYAAVVDGVLYDNHDSSRNGTRCVYGYWRAP